MYKFIVSLLMIFVAFTTNVRAAYEIPDMDKLLKPGAGAYSCVAEYLDGATYGSVLMTPVFLYDCAIGMEVDDDNEGCHEIGYDTPLPGKYINLQTGKMVDCPNGYYCPGSTAGLDSFKISDNATICGGDANIAEDGWSDDNANGTTLGKCKCPSGTTTGATIYDGLNSVTAADHCTWHICNPGQKLGIDPENGEYKCLPCDEDHYCVGGVYNSEYADKSMYECPTKTYAREGHSDVGAFRCSYKCPAGKAMRVYGTWFDGDTDCAPCPEGKFCPGDPDDPDTKKTYFAPTAYDVGIENDWKEFLVDNYLGTESCPQGKTTFGVEKTSANDCVEVHSCSAGTYWNIEQQTCLDCEEGYYCPGGNFPDDNGGEDGKVGMYECQQYYVEQVIAGGTKVVVFDPTHPDENSAFVHLSEPEANANGKYDKCTCPEGFHWNYDTHTCCADGINNGFCCPRGQEEHKTTHTQVKTCQTCSAARNTGVTVTGLSGSDNDYYYCPGSIVTLELSCTPAADEYFTVKKECKPCGDGSVPVSNSENAVATRCDCTPEALGSAFPSEPHDSRENLVRKWDPDSNTCKLDTYNIKVYYADITLTNRVSTHGEVRNGTVYPYWSTRYTWDGGVKLNDNNSNWDGNSEIPLGYLANNSTFAPTENGHIFTGYCRDTIFCCPEGQYKKEEMVSGLTRYTCETCSAGDEATHDCSGKGWTGPTTTVTIDPKNTDYEKPEIVFYAQMKELRGGCPAGTYLTWDSGNNQKCKNCPDGFYCPGGADLSSTNSGKNRCPADTYFGIDLDESTGVPFVMEGHGVYWDESLQQEIVTPTQNDRKRASDASDCKSCKVLYGGGHNKLVIPSSEAGVSYDQCGYYCNPGFYASDKDDHDPYSCDVPCEGPEDINVNGESVSVYNYCPGDGKHRYHGWSGNGWYWASKFYKVTEYGPGKGKFICPDGLVSDAPIDANQGGPRECYNPGCDKTEYRLKNAEAPNEGAYVCQPCNYPSGNNPTNKLYYQCLGGKSSVGIIIDGYLQPAQTDYRGYEYPGYARHEASGGRSQCGTKQQSVEDGAHAFECYNVYDPGEFENQFGEVSGCWAGYYCDPKEASGMLPCPAGSVSTDGAGSVDDCKCKYGEDFRPSGVYKERNSADYADTLKPVKLVKPDGTEETVCLNTYLAVDKKIAYESPGTDGDIPTANARVVECKWNVITNKYDICATKALRICNTSEWADETTGYAHKTIANGENGVLDDFRSALGVSWNTELFGVNAIASIDDIAVVGEACSIVCPVAYQNSGAAGACYATIEYDLRDGHLPDGVENPNKYSSGHPAITLNNPERDYHNFLGWCEGVDNTDCTPNNDTYTIAVDQSGDLFFTAKWQMVCPAMFPTYGEDRTDVNQCYATTTFYKNDGVTSDPVDVYTATFNSDDINAGGYKIPADSFPEVTRTGYTFGDWYLVENPSDDATSVDSDTLLSGNQSLYAHWTPIKYEVHFDGNGADNASDDPAPMANQEFTYDVAKNLTANAFEKTGYRFVGWCTMQDGCTETVDYTDGQEVINLADTAKTVTLYAQWEAESYTITYDPASLADATWPDSESNPNPTEYVITGTPITLINPVKDGHEFMGWCLDTEDQAICDINKMSTETDPDTGETTQVIKRVIAAGTYGNLTFRATWKALGCPTAYPNRDEDAELVKTTCYAKVTFDEQGGSEVSLNPMKIIYQSGAAEDNYTIATLPDSTRTGHNLDGWYQVENPGAADVKVTTPTTFTNDVTLYANWTPITYKIIFNGNGADNADVTPKPIPDMQMQYYDEFPDDVYLTSNNGAFVKANHALVGWCLSQDGCENGVDYVDGAKITTNLNDVPGRDVTLYAVWAINTYTINFDRNTTDKYADGEDKASIPCQYDSECSVGDQGSLRVQDYEFVCWMTEPDGTEANCVENGKITQTEALEDNTMTLYALWKPVCNSGKRLHVGDKDMCLYENSRTPVSLVVMINGVKYYANMCKASECDSSMSKDAENQKLHIMYNEELYNVYDLTARQSE